MATIDRPCYITRNAVRRALDVKQAAYASDRIDRAIMAGSDAVEDTCQRHFYPIDGVRQFDWPNYQYTYPWVLYLDQWELAAQPTLFTTGSLLPTPVVIPEGSYICQPINDGPPFTSIELRRDMNVAFGYNTTPQLDIAITGTFGYWMRTNPAGQFTASVGEDDITVQVSDGALVDAGDVLIAGSERMIVTDTAYVDTSISFTSGITTAQANDNVGVVPDGTAFSAGEVILVDFEWMLIQNIVGNNVVVKRAWSGAVLATHSGGPIWAQRQLSVMRGQLGTTPASYDADTAIVTNAVPGLCQEMALAEALVWLAQEPTGFGGGPSPQKTTTALRQGGSLAEQSPGAGLPDIRYRLENSQYTRKARSRVI
jgi:hypothetical protein